MIQNSRSSRCEELGAEEWGISDNENSEKNATDVGPLVNETQQETEMVSNKTEKGISKNQDKSNKEQLIF